MRSRRPIDIFKYFRFYDNALEQNSIGIEYQLLTISQPFTRLLDEQCNQVGSESISLCVSWHHFGELYSLQVACKT